MNGAAPARQGATRQHSTLRERQATPSAGMQTRSNAATTFATGFHASIPPFHASPGRSRISRSETVRAASAGRHS